jgi:hypothetical protein
MGKSLATAFPNRERLTQFRDTRAHSALSQKLLIANALV